MNILRTLRKRRGLTLEAVAEAVDSQAAHLSRIERGIANPSVDLLERLAAFFDTPLNALFTPGLAESELAFLPAPPAGQNALNPAALAPAVRSPVSLQLSRPGGAFGLPRGTVIIVDTHAQPTTGALLVLRITNPASGEADYRLARLAGDSAIGANFLSDPLDLYRLDSELVGIYGTVAAFAFGPALAATPLTA